MLEIRGNIYTKNFNFRPGTVCIDNGIITRVEIMSDEEFEASFSEAAHKRFIIPGLVDVHSHGCMGHDTCDADEEGLRTMLDFEKKHGITSYLPTTMTLSEEQLTKVCANIAKVAEKEPTIKGIYLEGPFISEAKKGAQNAAYIVAPDFRMVERLNAASGNRIKIVAIAPELEGSQEFIEEASKRYRLTVAHTTADYETAKAGFDSGIREVTHLYNAMPPYTHRAPGVVGAAMDSEEVMVEIIADGIHLHSSVVRGVFRMFGADRVILISDSMEATGMPDGEYSLGGQKVFMKSNRATLADGTIAGSAACLYDCLKSAISMGVAPEDAIRAATYNPAVAAGIADRVGTLQPGKSADLVILDESYEILAVYQEGRSVR